MSKGSSSSHRTERRDPDRQLEIPVPARVRLSIRLSTSNFD
jgi:hypothetical protein